MPIPSLVTSQKLPRTFERINLRFRISDTTLGTDYALDGQPKHKGKKQKGNQPQKVDHGHSQLNMYKCTYVHGGYQVARLVIELPDKLHRKLKTLAVTHCTTMKQIITHFVEQKLATINGHDTRSTQVTQGKRRSREGILAPVPKDQ